MKAKVCKHHPYHIEHKATLYATAISFRGIKSSYDNILLLIRNAIFCR
jgi:hypothetical protein